jgi:hypothetical protein
MEAKDILLQDENSLPTLEQNLSTATTTVSLPTVTAKPSTYAKWGASGVCSLIGMAYLVIGKKQNDVRKMIIGAALTLASLFLF